MWEPMPNVCPVELMKSSKDSVLLRCVVFSPLFRSDLVAEINALDADMHSGACNDSLHFRMPFSAAEASGLPAQCSSSSTGVRHRVVDFSNAVALQQLIQFIAVFAVDRSNLIAAKARTTVKIPTIPFSHSLSVPPLR